MNAAIEHLKNCDAKSWHLPPEAFHPSEERFWYWNDAFFGENPEFVDSEDVQMLIPAAEEAKVSTGMLRVFLSHWWSRREKKSNPFTEESKDAILEFLKKTRPKY